MTDHAAAARFGNRRGSQVASADVTPAQRVNQKPCMRAAVSPAPCAGRALAELHRKSVAEPLGVLPQQARLPHDVQRGMRKQLALNTMIV
jgi:hypothetical protein